MPIRPNPYNTAIAGITAGLQNLGLGYVEGQAKKQANQLYNKTLKSLDALLGQYYNPPVSKERIDLEEGIGTDGVSKAPAQTIPEYSQTNEDLITNNLYKAYFKGANLLGDYGDYGKTKAENLGQYLSAMLGMDDKNEIREANGNLFLINKRNKQVSQLTNNPQKVNYENTGVGKIPLYDSETDTYFIGQYERDNYGNSVLRKYPVTKEVYEGAINELKNKDLEYKLQTRNDYKMPGAPRAPKVGSPPARDISEQQEANDIASLVKDGLSWNSLTKEQKDAYVRDKMIFGEAKGWTPEQTDAFLLEYEKANGDKERTQILRKAAEQDAYIMNIDNEVALVADALKDWLPILETQTTLYGQYKDKASPEQLQIIEASIQQVIDAVYETLGSNYADYDEGTNQDRYNRFFTKYINPHLSKAGMTAHKFGQ